MFIKRDRSYYSEAHHLIPLGGGGAASVSNIGILNPLIHRMLHYAKVEGIDLEQIENNQLIIKINDVEYTMKWHPEHGKIVKESGLLETE